MISALVGAMVPFLVADGRNGGWHAGSKGGRVERPHPTAGATDVVGKMGASRNLIPGGPRRPPAGRVEVPMADPALQLYNAPSLCAIPQNTLINPLIKVRGVSLACRRVLGRIVMTPVDARRRSTLHAPVRSYHSLWSCRSTSGQRAFRLAMASMAMSRWVCIWFL